MSYRNLEEGQWVKIISLMKYYYTYIVECRDKSFYVGITNNYERRVCEHNKSANFRSYTYTRRPVKLVHVEEFTYVLDAIAREKQIKKWSRKKKQALINCLPEDLIFGAKRKKRQQKIEEGLKR